MHDRENSLSGIQAAALRGRSGAMMSRASAVAQPVYFMPFLGMIGSIAGMLFAIATVPFDASKPGGLVIPACGMAIGLLVAPVAAGILNPRNFLRTENIIGACPVYWLMLEQIEGGYEMKGVTDATIRMGFLYTGLFGVFFWTGVQLKWLRLPKSVIQSCALRVSTRTLFPVAVLCFSLAMMAFALPCKFNLGLMYDGLFMGRFEAPWSSGALGGWKSFTDHLSYFGYLLPTLSVMQAKRRGWTNPTVVISIILSLVVMLFIAQGGGRRIIGVCFGAATIYWLLDQPKLTWGRLAPAGLVLILLTWLLQTILYARTGGLGHAKVAGELAASGLKGEKVTETLAVHIDNNFYRMCQVTELIPSRYPYSYHEFIVYVLVRPIPRAIWENKPVWGGFDLGYFFGEGASLSCSILGELHISLGIFAVMLGSLVIGLMSRLSDPLFCGKKDSVAPMFYGYMTMWLFVGFRSMIEVMLFSYPILVWMLIVKVFRNAIQKNLARS